MVNGGPPGYRGSAVGSAQVRPRGPVRSGGHSPSGTSLVPDGLLIDLRGMNHVRVDPARRSAVVGGGTTKRGQPYQQDYCYVFRVAGGRLTQVTEYLDSALVEKLLDPPQLR